VEDRREGILSVVESNLPDVFTAMIALDVTSMTLASLSIVSKDRYSRCFFATKSGKSA